MFFFWYIRANTLHKGDDDGDGDGDDDDKLRKSCAITRLAVNRLFAKYSRTGSIAHKKENTTI
jgi:hypothetical protein